MSTNAKAGVSNLATKLPPRQNKTRCMAMLSDTGALGRSMARIRQLEPQYAAKLDAQFARMDEEFFERAERSIARFEGLCQRKTRPWITVSIAT
jgi:hypothetical protein